MSFKVEVKVIGETKYATNGIVLATEEEARAYARDLTGRWMMVEDWRVITSEDVPNYTIDANGKATAIR